MTTTDSPVPPAARRGALLGVGAMACVGSSVAVSQTIVDAPLFTLQALRYALAAVLLLAFAAATRRPLPRPRGVEWLWLVGVALSGLVLFNIAVVRGVAHAEPAVIGVAVASVPLLLAVAGPLLAGARPTPTVVIAAAVVSAGAVLVQGGGRTDAVGLGWAAVVLLTEVGFTLLAVPVLGRLGPWAVSLHAVWIAALALLVLGVAVDGPFAVTRLDAGDLLAALHLAVVVTALAFVLWYSAVRHLGAGRAGTVHRGGAGDRRGRWRVARRSVAGGDRVARHGRGGGRAGDRLRGSSDRPSGISRSSRRPASGRRVDSGRCLASGRCVD